jgi:hypothetical protein
MTGSTRDHDGAACGYGSSWSWIFLAFGAMAVVLLWQEHRIHLLGAIPYLILLACPLMHLFMHRGHRHGGHREEDHHA